MESQNSSENSGKSVDEAVFSINSVDEVVLFKKSIDEFVNEGIAEIAYLLKDKTGESELTVTETEVKLNRSKLSELQVRLEDLLISRGGLASQTHRLTSAAKEVNETAEKTEYELNPPGVPFPENETQRDKLSFENDELNEKTLVENGFLPDSFDWSDDGRTVYSLSPSYVGSPQDSNVEKVEDIIGKFVSSLSEQEDNYSPCECCGREDIPTQEIEYNQSFSLKSTKSTEKPLGSKSSQSSGSKGRCLACLLAGWVYTMMSKPVSPIDVGSNEYRVFGFEGGLDTLFDIREALSESTSGELLMDINKSTYTNIPRPNTESRKLESILVLGRLRELLQKRVEKDGLMSGTELVDLKPTGMYSFYSCPLKSGNYVRNIKSIESVDINDYLWELLSRKNVSKSEEYSPTEDILGQYARMNDGESEIGIREKEKLGEGFQLSELQFICDGLFDLFKVFSKNESVIVSIKGEYAEHYFTQVVKSMSDSLSSDELESIKRVGEHIGEVFSEYSDIGTLSSLKNANTPEEFVRKMDTVATDAFKKGHQNTTNQYVPDSDEVSEFLEVILDEEKFGTAKNVFIVHATMSAQYQTMVKRSSQSETDSE